jgi:hypothetical protein
MSDQDLDRLYTISSLVLAILTIAALIIFRA